MLVNILSTKERIKFVISLPDIHCFLCESATESIQHLLLECPIVKLSWWSSPWQIRIQNFSGISPIDWISILLNIITTPHLPVELLEEEQLLHFTVVTFERMWMERNLLRLGNAKPNWQIWSSCIKFQFQSYWKLAVQKKQKNNGRVFQTEWQPPLPSEVKFNFDVAVDDLLIYAGIVLRNHLGKEWCLD